MDGSDMEDLIKNLLDREWEMFPNVSNEGGRADCQDDRDTFDIMRKSQFSIWNRECLLSYLNDLEQARQSGRNLMTEKYGYMMADTAPNEFERIKNLLPEVTEEKERLSEELTEKQVVWMERFRKLYPDLGKRGRPLRRHDSGSALETSLETYSHGELLTYSVETLRLLKRRFEQLEQEYENPGILVMEATARQYGYRSVQEAQDHLKSLNEKSVLIFK